MYYPNFSDKNMYNKHPYHPDKMPPVTSGNPIALNNAKPAMMATTIIAMIPIYFNTPFIS